MKWLAYVLCSLALLACAPSGSSTDDGSDSDSDDNDGNGFVDAGNGGGFIDAGNGNTGGNVSGTVWAPGMAPGMVPDGHEIPVANAVVYVTTQSVPELPEGVYCDQCQEKPPNAVLTDAKGKFSVKAPAGDVTLVIEKAQFRLEQPITVEEGTPLALGDAETTLPSVHDPDAGKWLPRVAIAVGESDHVEDIFGKMRILRVGSSGTTEESSFDDTDRVELWGNPGAPPYVSKHKGTISDLFGSLEKMRRYHIIFVPCNYYSTVIPTAAMRKNIRDYVEEGGKLFVTDWSAEWSEGAFPEFVELDATIDTTAPMAASNVINPADGDFGHFAFHARADDPSLRAWLDGQQGPLVVPLGDWTMDFPSEYEEGTIDADDFVIEGAWNMIKSLPSVNLGTDDRGMPIIETAKTWITGDFTDGFEEYQLPYNNKNWPHTVTFEPSCGRVMYSTYHTANQPHQGLVAQERVLLYLMLEIGVCNDGPIIVE